MAKLAALIGGGLLVVGVCIFLGMLAFAAVRDLYEWASKTIRERNKPGSPEAIARYGEPVVLIDDRVYAKGPTAVTQLLARVKDYRPEAANISAPRKRSYVPVVEGTNLRLPTLAGQDIEQPPVIDAYTDVLTSLLEPSERPADKTLREALARATGDYPVAPPTGPPTVPLPNLGNIPGAFDLPHPSIVYPDGRALADLKAKEVAVFRPWTSRYEDAVAEWNEKEATHRALLLRLRDALGELKARLAAANQTQEERFRQAHIQYASDKSEYEREQFAERVHLQALIDEWDNCIVEAPARLAELTLRYMPQPKWLPTSIETTFDPESAVLIVEMQFPDVGRIKWYRRGTTPPKPATKTEARAAAEALYQTLALRYAWEVARTANDNFVQTVVVNGWAEYVDGATGETKRTFVTSLLAKVAALRALNLPKVDVHQAFAALKGVAGRAQTVTPVAPVVRMNTNDRRFVDPKAVLDDVGEQNLATMDWGDFEHLCRELFERVFAGVGAEVRVTQASRDQGVDAVIFDPDPIRGGKIVIQAKRYSGTVDVSAVRDLYGTLQHEGAMKGILVTTSGFGPDAYAFIAGKPLTLINGGELLGILAQHGYNFRIDLAEAKKAAREQATRARKG